MKSENIEINDLISLKNASIYSKLSQGHLNYLIRNDKLWGIKLGRNWFTTKEAIESYLDTPRKPGPQKT